MRHRSRSKQPVILTRSPTSPRHTHTKHTTHTVIILVFIVFIIVLFYFLPDIKHSTIYVHHSFQPLILCLASSTQLKSMDIEDPDLFTGCKEDIHNNHEAADDMIRFYASGLPLQPRVFARDTFITALLLPVDHPETQPMLQSIIAISQRFMGNKVDITSGEEPGKIFQELPSTTVKSKQGSKSTAYSASDTTALYLIAMHRLWNNFEDRAQLSRERFRFIERALEYIFQHIDERGLFIEHPSFSGDEDGSLAYKATYWKNSAIHDRTDGIPAYPIAYTVVNAAIIHALRCVQDMTGHDVGGMIDSILTAFNNHLYDERNGVYFAALDQEGPILGASSDSLHSLWHLEPRDIHMNRVHRMLSSFIASELNTQIGFACEMSTFSTKKKPNKYDELSVWPVEQAIIHKASTKFSMHAIRLVSEKIMSKLTEKFYPEYYRSGSTGWIASGSSLQLWTLGASEYFKTVKIDCVLLDGQGVVDLKLEMINDDYCDCQHGIDEPGTSACTYIMNEAKYECLDRSKIWSSRVGDGICDCAECEDESSL